METGADAAMPDGASSPTCVFKGLLKDSDRKLLAILAVLEEDVLSAPRGLARMQAVHAAYKARCNKVKGAMASEGGHHASILLGQILEHNKHDDKHDEVGSLYYKLDLAHSTASSCVLRDVQNLNKILHNMTPHIVTLAVNNVGCDEHTFLNMVHIFKAAMPIDATAGAGTPGPTLPRAFTVRVLMLLGMMDQEHKIAAQQTLNKITGGEHSVNDKDLEQECRVKMCQFMTREVPQRVKHVDLCKTPRELRKVRKMEVESCFPPLDTGMSLQTALESMCSVAALLREMDEETKSLQALLPDNEDQSEAAGSKRKKPEVEKSVLLRAEALLFDKTQSGVETGAKGKKTSVSSYKSEIEKTEAEMKSKLLRMQTMLEAATGELNKPSYSNTKAMQADFDVYELYVIVYNMAADCMQRNMVLSFVKVLMAQIIKNTDAQFVHTFALDDQTKAKFKGLLQYEGSDIFAQRSDVFCASSTAGIFASKEHLFSDMDWCLCLNGLVHKMVAEVADSESESLFGKDDLEECDEVLGSGSVLR